MGAFKSRCGCLPKIDNRQRSVHIALRIQKCTVWGRVDNNCARLRDVISCFGVITDFSWVKIKNNNII
jgi:hypothetical protein